MGFYPSAESLLGIVITPDFASTIPKPRNLILKISRVDQNAQTG